MTPREQRVGKVRKGHDYGRPLEVKIERGALVIRIGNETLAHAATYGDWAHDCQSTDEGDEYVRTFAITDPLEFAGDVLHEMLREREDGSSPLSDFLDAMSKAAVEEGSMACEYEQRIEFGKASPLETWKESA